MGRSRAAKPTCRDGLPQGLPYARSAANLLFASEVIQSEGVSMSDTVTAHAVRVGDNSQPPDGVSVRSMDVPRGGSAARSAFSPEIEKLVESHKTQENKAFLGRPASSAGRSSENHLEYIPILPAEISVSDGADSAFRFLGSKTDPILHVRYPSPWNIVADFAAKSGENLKNSKWRRGWDSNPRTVAHRRFSRPVLSSTQPPLRFLIEEGTLYEVFTDFNYKTPIYSTIDIKPVNRLLKPTEFHYTTNSRPCTFPPKT